MKENIPIREYSIPTINKNDKEFLMAWENTVTRVLMQIAFKVIKLYTLYDLKYIHKIHKKD